MVQTDFSVVDRVAPTVDLKWLRNPGIFYNVGNGLALFAAIFHCAVRANLDVASSISELRNYFFGTWPALFTSLAVVAFLFSGRKYAQAWASGFPPVERANQTGHLVSAFGAILIGLGLIGFSVTALTLALAIITTLLHAGGKFGSWWSKDRIDLFKVMPLVSRVTYGASLAFDIQSQIAKMASFSDATVLLLPSALIFATLFWARADWLLRPKVEAHVISAETPRPQRHSPKHQPRLDR